MEMIITKFRTEVTPGQRNGTEDGHRRGFRCACNVIIIVSVISQMRNGYPDVCFVNFNICMHLGYLKMES